MDNIDYGYMKYKKLKIYRRILFFLLGFGSVIVSVALYVYEWNRMPDVFYLEAGEEQVIDMNIPVKGFLYCETVQANNFSDEAVESISNASMNTGSAEVDFSREMIIKGSEENIYCADLKLLGVLPYKTIRFETINTHSVIPSGQPIGIYVKMKGIYVIDTGDFMTQDNIAAEPCKDKLQSDDYIIDVNGDEISRKKDFTQMVQESEGTPLSFTVLRGDEERTVTVTPVKALDGTYKIGAWIRDSLQGVGTMTFMEEDGDYGALGHAVRDADTNELIQISSGTLYETKIVSISPGKSGEPGEITGLIQYEKSKQIGDIEGNTIAGIYGCVTKKDWAESSFHQPMEVALKQEIELGEAYIISGITGTCEKYAVEIIDIKYNSSENKKAITLRVTDEKLLELTGGIVQGMSGSPIIQNEKLIGAVTHVLVNEPEKGYGIFIESMLKNKN